MASIVFLVAALGVPNTEAEPLLLSANAGWDEVGPGAASGGGLSTTSGRSDSPSQAMSPDGAPVVAWDDDRGDGEEIYIRRWNGSTWAEIGNGSATGGGISSTPGASTSPSLVVASDGSPLVAWETSAGADYEIYLRRWNGSAWVAMGGSASGGGISNNNAGSYAPSLVVDAGGAPIVAWYDAGDGDWEIYVRRWNGSSWVEMGDNSAAGGGISNNSGSSRLPSLAVGPDGVPIIAWEDDSSGNLEIYVRRWNGSAWVEMGSGSAAGGGVSNNAGASQKPRVVIAPDNTPLIAWDDATSGDAEIYVRRWNGSAWVEMGSGSASGGGISNNAGNSYTPSPVISANGTPIIAWHDNSSSNWEAYVRRWNGLTWVEMDSGSAAGGGISNNAGNSYTPSLAVAPDGRVFVVWADATAGNYEIYARSNPPVETGCFSLSVNKVGLGDVTVSPVSACYEDQTQVKLTAVPISGYTFSGWSGDISGNNNPYFLSMTGNKSVTATFNPQPPTCYSLSRSHSGSGSDPAADPANSTGCATGQYTAGQAITLTAAPTAGWRVKNWSGTANDGSTASTNTLTMPAAGNAVSVTYENIPPVCYNLSRSHSGSGSDPAADPANSTGCATGQYTAGQAITLTAAPTAGWRVKNWSGTANDGSTATTNTLTMPAAGHAVSVTYELVPVVEMHLAYTPLVLYQLAPPVCFPGPNEVEPNDTAAAANGPLCNGITYKGRPDDEYDIFYVDLKRPGDITVTMSNHLSANVQLALHYQVISLNALDIDANGSDGFSVGTTNGQPGRYIIVIFVPKENTGGTAQYSLRATFAD